MRLILARHGNTFNPGDKVSWVGSKNDLPLVEHGIVQAERVAAALKSNGISIDAIYYAPLLRTKRFAEIVAFGLDQDIPLLEDERLTELDYGDWSGLSDDEVVSRFGDGVLRDWLENSVWPEHCGWLGNESTVTSEIKDFASHIGSAYPSHANVLAVSSNGRLRYFLKLVANEFQKRVTERTFKVATGRICVLDKIESSPRIALWNEQPEALLNLFQNR